MKSRDGSVSIVIGYGLDDRGSIPDRGKEGKFFLRHRVQIGSGVHLTSYATGIGGSYLRGKAAGV
jgi:hypothetical protein